MNTRRNAARWIEEEIANVGSPPHCEKVPPLKEDANVDQASVNPPPLTIGDIRAILIQFAQGATLQAQAIMAQANWELIPRPHQQVTTKASRIRYFTWMNSPTLYGFKVDEDPQEFTDEVSKILLAMGLTTSKKTELATYQLQDVAQVSYVQWRDNRPLRGVHARRVEEAKAKRNSRNSKRARSFDGGSSKNKLEIQDNPRFKKQVYNQVPSMFPKDRDGKGNITRSKKGRSVNSTNEKLTCSKCGNGHLGECLVRTGNCFSCGKSGHKMRYCPKMNRQERGGQDKASGSSDAIMKNHFCTLRCRGEQETTPDMVTNMLKDFTIDIYD
ncbi:hypothetical protein EJD97_018752 [Solanum chilense]|uniref:CCHC-type domain-containing protein n=1 Tax=Solanum chilense TaxID=4083 RepID=A0A6N2CK00_SOLCI|nr:hypothetical protein EJD97_018752 [Solanum chilense]